MTLRENLKNIWFGRHIVAPPNDTRKNTAVQNGKSSRPESYTHGRMLISRGIIPLRSFCQTCLQQRWLKTGDRRETDNTAIDVILKTLKFVYVDCVTITQQWICAIKDRLNNRNASRIGHVKRKDEVAAAAESSRSDAGDDVSLSPLPTTGIMAATGQVRSKVRFVNSETGIEFKDDRTVMNSIDSRTTVKRNNGEWVSSDQACVVDWATWGSFSGQIYTVSRLRGV